MLLNEILNKTHPDIRSSSKPMPRGRNLEYNTPKNWENVGRGQQSNVFTHPLHPNKVIKVTVALNDVEDPTYQFIRLCKSNQDNPYFPKIYNIKKYPSGDESVLVISLEKLKPLDVSDFEKLKQVMSIPFVSDDDKHGSTVGGIHHSFQSQTVRRYIMKNTPDTQLKQALRLLEPLFRHYGPDMHLGNIMKRTNGQIVFIDPITYEMFDD